MLRAVVKAAGQQPPPQGRSVPSSPFLGLQGAISPIPSSGMAS
jgi:hypothetical protein